MTSPSGDEGGFSGRTTGALHGEGTDLIMAFQMMWDRKRSIRAALAVPLLAILLVTTACGSDDDEGESPPDVGISVTSGSFTTTVRAEGVTEVPFSETVTVDVLFEESIYGAAGQTSVFAQAQPTSYRVDARPRRNELTYTFALTNRTPGTVEVSIFANRDSQPVTFTLAIGVEEE
jgi:hypothetical protein